MGHRSSEYYFTFKNILGDVIKDIEHIGSTSIPSIKAKPIIDIAVAVDSFNDILSYEKELRNNGFYYQPKADIYNQLLFACGDYYTGFGDLKTHFIYVVITNSMEWRNYINFRDYLNSRPCTAKEYENLKISLALQVPIYSKREKYFKGKRDFIIYVLRKALVNSYLGKIVNINIDRPIGSVHPKYNDLIYPINYGYIPNVLSGDGKELDAYLLGVDVPVKEYRAHIIGIVHRHNDIEDKLVAAPEGMNYNTFEIEKEVYFQERYYNSEIESIFEKSCGTILYTVIDKTIHYLLIRSRDNGNYGFPKGHVERDETEIETALRETWEETSINATIVNGFKRDITYTVGNEKIKSVTYFLASYLEQTPKHNNGFEYNDYFLLPFDEACKKLTFENIKNLLKEANDFIKRIK